MNQRGLFFESFEQALDEDIRALGGRKTVAMRLRPELKPHDAHTWLNSCLNPNRDYKLDDKYIRLIMRWAREIGAQAAMDYWCDDTGFERAKALTAKEEASVLIDRATDLARESRNLAQALERLAAGQTLRAIGAKTGS